MSIAQRPLVALGLPTFDEVKADFALSLAMMVASTRTVQFAFNHFKGTLIANARNNIAEGALKLGAEWLLFLDSDMTFPRETLTRLMSWNKDIVCASYVKRAYPHHTVGSLVARPGDEVGKPALVETNGLYEMEKIGLGVCLIKMEVFKKLPRPWFGHEFRSGSNAMVGEDIFWCHNVRKLGYRIWIDAALSMHVGHIGNHIFRPEQAYSLFDPETGQRKQDADVVAEQVQLAAAANG
jgi:hypothetical protein